MLYLHWYRSKFTPPPKVGIMLIISHLVAIKGFSSLSSFDDSVVQVLFFEAFLKCFLSEYGPVNVKNVMY